jgi:hypothetical protein
MNTAEYKKQKRKIMRAVYRAYVLRTATQPVSLELFLMCGLTFVGSFFVSFKAILLNAETLRNPDSAYHFFVSAFDNTHLTVKILCVMGIITAGLFMSEVCWKVGGRLVRLAHAYMPFSQKSQQTA